MGTKAQSSNLEEYGQAWDVAESCRQILKQARFALNGHVAQHCCQAEDLREQIKGPEGCTPEVTAGRSSAGRYQSALASRRAGHRLTTLPCCFLCFVESLKCHLACRVALVASFRLALVKSGIPLPES